MCEKKGVFFYLPLYLQAVLKKKQKKKLQLCLRKEIKITVENEMEKKEE